MENGPKAPPERFETARQRILEALRQGPVSAKEISAAAGVSERGLAGQLKHVDRSLRAAGEKLRVVPARCRSCGFVFAKRERFSRPGKCPVCKSGRIQPPLFTVE
jgi:hypothetical protein